MHLEASFKISSRHHFANVLLSDETDLSLDRGQMKSTEKLLKLMWDGLE